ncbi:MAG: ABC transporter permease [Cytophagales bacterium]|nr:ABC transporter permease [Cytophagales bacterium]
MKDRKSLPPRFPLRFFRWYCHPEYREDIEGDLMERFECRLEEKGIRSARWEFFMDVMLLFRPGIVKSLFGNQKLNSYVMYRYHIKFAWRSLIRNRQFSIINILGLTLGLSCCILIYSFVKYHSSFDDFHADTDRIYRFVTEEHLQNISYTPAVHNPFGKVFREEFTYAEKVARVCTEGRGLITVGEQDKYREAIAFAETEYFGIMNFPLVRGTAEKALSQPNSVVLTESLAQKYFGAHDPVSRTLELDNKIPLTVTGVLKDIPKNSDFRTQLYISYSTLSQYNPWYTDDNSWGGISSNMKCFVRLKAGVNAAMVEASLSGLHERFRPDRQGMYVYKLQPLKDVHFSSLYGGVVSKRNLVVLVIIGLFLLVAACFNFINLATALVLRRSREIGISKVIGGTRSSLFLRFMVETSLITFLSISLALLVSRISIPRINRWLGDTLRFDDPLPTDLLFFLPILFFLVVFVSGSYPGVVLARLSPITTLKGKLAQHNFGGFNIRRTLIVGQFVISQLLIVGLIVIVHQMKFTQSDLGFAKDAIVIVPTGSEDEKMKTLKNELLRLSGVDNVSTCLAPPAAGDNSWSLTFYYDNRNEPEGYDIQFKSADEDYLATFDIDLVAGRNLLPCDTVREFLVNETFVKKLNLASPGEVIGKKLAVNGRRWKGTVVGVIKDFYDQSFHAEKNPVCITTHLKYYRRYAIRLNGSDYGQTLTSIGSYWSERYPDQLFSYEFLDDRVAKLYETEHVILNLVQAFTALAILIGCIGLFGLVSFMVSRKKKEVAIRKILGAAVSSILAIFSMEFLKLILVSTAIAAPLGWWVMSGWLENFTYKINLGLWIFALSFGICAIISMLTIGFQSAKAAWANPVDFLQDE